MFLNKIFLDRAQLVNAFSYRHHAHTHQLHNNNIYDMKDFVIRRDRRRERNLNRAFYDRLDEIIELYTFKKFCEATAEGTSKAWLTAHYRNELSDTKISTTRDNAKFSELETACASQNSYDILSPQPFTHLYVDTLMTELKTMYFNEYIANV